MADRRACDSAGSTGYRSREYSGAADLCLDLSPVQRQGKIQKECGPITNEHLRASCVDSRNIDEDRRPLGLRDGLTGGGDGRMNPIDRTFQGPEMYDPRFGR